MSVQADPKVVDLLSTQPRRLADYLKLIAEANEELAIRRLVASRKDPRYLCKYSGCPRSIKPFCRMDYQVKHVLKCKFGSCSLASNQEPCTRIVEDVANNLSEDDVSSPVDTPTLKSPASPEHQSNEVSTPEQKPLASAVTLTPYTRPKFSSVIRTYLIKPGALIRPINTTRPSWYKGLDPDYQAMVDKRVADGTFIPGNHEDAETGMEELDVVDGLCTTKPERPRYVPVWVDQTVSWIQYAFDAVDLCRIDWSNYSNMAELKTDVRRLTLHSREAKEEPAWCNE